MRLLEFLDVHRPKDNNSCPKTSNWRVFENLNCVSLKIAHFGAFFAAIALLTLEM